MSSHNSSDAAEILVGDAADNIVDNAVVTAVSLESLAEDFNQMKVNFNEIILNNRRLKETIKRLSSEIKYVQDALYYAEINITKQDQYSRRSNIELSGIPENINQRDLEPYIIRMLSYIGVVVSSYDIVACHRLGKYLKSGKNRKVIVRFLNRKHAHRSLKNSVKLKSSARELINYTSIYITENLCPTNRNIFNTLYKLKKNNNVTNLWTFNGDVYYKISSEADARTYKASHIDDVNDYFYDGNDFSFFQYDEASP